MSCRESSRKVALLLCASLFVTGCSISQTRLHLVPSHTPVVFDESIKPIFITRQQKEEMELVPVNVGTLEGISSVPMDTGSAGTIPRGGPLCARAIELDPGNYAHQVNLGHAHLLLGDRQTART